MGGVRLATNLAGAAILGESGGQLSVTEGADTLSATGTVENASTPLEDLVTALNAAATWTAFYICEPTYLTLSGSEITEWRDASGNARHLAPAGTGPTFDADGSNNGLRGIANPGSAGRLLRTGMPDINGTRVSAFAVGRPNTGQHGFFTVVDATLGETDGAVSGITNDGGTGASAANSTSDGSEHCYFLGMRASPHGTMEVDGVETSTVTTGTAACSTSYTTLHVMTDGFLNEPGYPTSFFGYGLTQFSAPAIAAIEAALATYYGITFS